jgi:XTP/dITP diphosphohydrolase
MARPTIFFGTHNPHKLREIEQIIGELYQVKSFRDLPEPMDVEETEPTLEGNAALKARAYFAETHIPCFADDTGLEVDALHGRPGVRSARYAGPEGIAEQNIAKLLGELSGKQNRRARFRTVIAFFDGEEMRYFEGKVEGEILEAPQGSEGFGYDPVFQPEGADRSFAQFSPEEKNAISHRGKSVRAFADFLRKRIQEQGH